MGPPSAEVVVVESDRGFSHKSCGIDRKGGCVEAARYEIALPRRRWIQVGADFNRLLAKPSPSQSNSSQPVS
jgi:hypothetical protein